MSLYDKNNKYTSVAHELDQQTFNAVYDVFKDFIRQGYSPREISYTMQNAIRDIELNILITNGEIDFIMERKDTV